MREEDINLSKQDVDFIRRSIEAGRFKDATEVVGAGLRLLEEHEDKYAHKLERLRAELQRGLDAREEGRYLTFNSEEELQTYSEEIRRRGRRRLGETASGSSASPE